MKCPSCGCEQPETSKYCSNCGRPLKVESGSNPSFNGQQNRNQSGNQQQNLEAVQELTTYWMILIIATVVLIIGSVLWIRAGFTIIDDLDNYQHSIGYNYRSPLTSHEKSMISQLLWGLVMDAGASIALRVCKKKFNEISDTQSAADASLKKQGGSAERSSYNPFRAMASSNTDQWAMQCISGELLGAEIPIGLQGITIGRSPECNIILSHPSVSRIHCRVWHGNKPGEYYVRDHSGNGIVGQEGNRIPVGHAVLFHSGETFRIADSENTFQFV